MNFREEIVQFDCEGDDLLGIVARPDQAKDIGVVIVVGGPQYRAGSHRQFVLLSRRLASEGFACMRFDLRGMGDSSGDFPGFEHVTPDIGSAVDAFRRNCPAVERIVLLGLCDAASASLIYVGERRDPNVFGLCLLNPWVRSEQSLARTRIRHYYVQRLLSREFWEKLLTGRFVATAAVKGMFLSAQSSVRSRLSEGEGMTFQARMAKGWQNFGGGTLVVLAERDYTAKEFSDYAETDSRWRRLLRRASVRCRRVPGADHTFSSHAWRCEVENHLISWLYDHEN